jgi:hypothetical protein
MLLSTGMFAGMLLTVLNTKTHLQQRYKTNESHQLPGGIIITFPVIDNLPQAALMN